MIRCCGECSTCAFHLRTLNSAFTYLWCVDCEWNQETEESKSNKVGKGFPHSKVHKVQLSFLEEGKLGSPDCRTGTPPQLHWATGPPVLLLPVCVEGSRELHKQNFNIRTASACNGSETVPRACMILARSKIHTLVSSKKLYPWNFLAFTRHGQPNFMWELCYLIQDSEILKEDGSPASYICPQ